MPVTDSAKLDYLWKKVGYGVTKTAPPDNKEAFNESIPSPLLYRGDLVMVDSGDIPAVIPTTSSSIVEVYKDNASGNSWSATIECTEDLTAPDNRTWKTNLQNWIPTQFGSTYLVKVYVANASVSNPQTVGTQLFQAGSGNNDEWFFDYQSGVLNFNGINIPSVIGTGITGKSVYISGARYIGEFGVGGQAALGNIVIGNTTITTDGTIANITIEPTASADGMVLIDATTGILLPSGNIAQRPGNAVAGTIRYNSSTDNVEYYDGNVWAPVGTSYASITTQVLYGDNSTDVFVLDQTATNNSVIVVNNGVVQQPGIAYDITGNVITFAEPPALADTVTVRFVSVVTTFNEITNDSGTYSISVDESGVGNLAATQSVQLPTYTSNQAANLANTSPGQMIFVTDGDSGSPCLAIFSEGNWRRVALGANIAP